MNISTRAFLTAAAVLAALTGSPTLYAFADSSGPQTPEIATPGDHGGMTGDAAGMSQMMSEMTEMMNSCNTMMTAAAPHDRPETPSDGGRQ